MPVGPAQPGNRPLDHWLVMSADVILYFGRAAGLCRQVRTEGGVLSEDVERVAPAPCRLAVRGQPDHTPGPHCAQE
ncbi:MAG: hypothetical protein M1531_08140, partial [Chloroflexi bacterium]|nr:hypothetical protein [Chloroflexota bacterium]